MKAVFRWSVAFAIVGAMVGLIGYFLINNGFVRMNHPSRIIYPVQGLDISHHQGKIEFQKVKNSGWVFVIMKSTEGGDWKDTRFKDYYQQARQSGLVVGVYHYYSFCKDPVVQAEHFISVAGDLKGCLPPAVDLEFDHNCNGSIPVLEFRKGFVQFVDRIKEEYGTLPIVYCNEDFYNKYLADDAFSECYFWVRDIVAQPDLEGRPWAIWQYTAKGKVSGINGFVDLNAFAGSSASFEEMILD